MANNGLLSYKHLSKINRWQKYSSDIYAIWYRNIISKIIHYIHTHDFKLCLCTHFVKAPAICW